MKILILNPEKKQTIGFLKIQVAGMINKHYQDLSDDNLIKTHNQLFPERTTNHKNNIKTKKWRFTTNSTANHLKKCYYLLLIDWVRKTERPFNMEEQHKITKKDKFILTTVLIIIFVGVLGLGLIGVIVSLSG